MPDYEVRIPGIRQIIKLQESQFSKLPEKTRERIIRMKAQKSPIPEKLRWIPGLIKHIDDAQDLLFTAAYLAKPLLRRVPKKFIPYVGWALTLMDIANMVDFVLGFAMSPCLRKPDFINSTKHTFRYMKHPRTKWEVFVKSGGWRGRLAFALQAGQALDSVFGKGLILGSLMGLMSDFTWLAIRKMGGEKYGVKFKAPKSDDPVYTAIKMLTYQPMPIYAHDILSPEDHLMLIAAENVAVGMLTENLTPPTESRINEFLSTPVGVPIPDDPNTLRVLEEEGIPLDGGFRGFWPDNEKQITFGQMIDNGLNEYDSWAAAMQNLPVDQETLTAYYAMQREAGEDMLSFMGVGDPSEYQEPDQMMKLIMKYTEYNVGIPNDLPVSTQRAFLEEAGYQASLSGRSLPISIDFEWAAKKMNIPFGSRSLQCDKGDTVCYLSFLIMNRSGAFRIYNAMVSIIGSGFSTHTDEGGYANFWGVPKGQYTLEVSHRCFTTYSTPINIQSSSKLVSKIALDQVPNSRITEDSKQTADGAWDYRCVFF
jgi:hypothetical protein